jgi:predicted CXXCH cytochrome family protein
MKKLLTKPEETLCFNCHKQTRVEMGRFNRHQPFSRGQCSACHDPHGGEQRGLLKKSPNKGELCLTCHQNLAPKMADKKAHLPFADGD